MPDTTNTDSTKVAVGSALVTGAIFVAPTTVALPTDASTALAEGFKCLGFTSDAGLTLSESSSTNSLRVWEGLAEARTIKTERTEQMKFTPVQVNADVAKTIWGDDHVTADTSTGALSIGHHGGTLPPIHIVVEMVPFDGAVQRLAGKVQLTEIGDATYDGQSFEGRELTFNCLVDSTGHTLHEYVAYTN